MERKYGEYQKILLNLKWFVKQLCRVFEEKLERRCSREQWSTLSTGGGSGVGSGLDNSSLDGGNSDIMSSVSSTHSSPKHLSWTHSLSNSPLLRRLAAFQQKHTSPKKQLTNSVASNNSNHSNHSSNNNNNNNSCNHIHSNSIYCSGTSCASSRLLMLRLGSTRAEREFHIRRFGEHLAVVYEYQIGMLNSLQAVSVLVAYVADLLLKAIKKGILLGLDPAHLNPTILFDCTIMPKSGSKLVKTVGIGVHGNSLTWKVNNIFTHPGLRHNQVGGEDCTNLSIVTHLLTGFCPFGESRRPDIYGYRNLIVVPRRRMQKMEKDKKLVTNMTAYEISLYDSSTIGHARSHSDESTQSTSTNSLLDHIHKCYKSIFFVIFERPNVIEHLMSCQSFRVFCTKELITPVMFLTAFSEATLCSTHKSLFNNFDLFNICVTTQPKLLLQGNSNCGGSERVSSVNLPAKFADSDVSINIANNGNNNNNNSSSNNNNNSNKSSSINKVPSDKQNTDHDYIITPNAKLPISTAESISSFSSREYDNFGFHI